MCSSDLHLAQLMEQGRAQWQELEELGRAAAAAQAGAAGAAAAPAEEPLERAWARFETEQELEELRRRQG